jgi:hypothetical protein
VLDNRNNPIEIQIVKSNKKDDNDLYLYMKSEMKHTRPNQEQARLYSALNFKQSNPQMRKKAVAPHS